jgi:cytoskeletal protein CcmA (bactofilin family)
MMFGKRSQEKSVQELTRSENISIGETSARRFTKGAPAVIGSTVKIKGEVQSEEDLVVDGLIEGTVLLKNNELVVGSSGRVHADVKAKSVKVDGELHGDVEAGERIVITANGVMRGNIQAPRVILEDGSKFKGSIDMDEAAPSKSFGVISKPESSVASDAGAS